MNEYYLALGVSFGVFSVLAGGLNLVYGYTGLLSFAQVAFFGIGGYTAALLVTERGWSLWTGAAAGGLLAALAGLAIGYSSLRLSRHAFAIVSLSFALLCMIVARDWVTLTRGPMGIPGLPVPVLDLPGGLRWRLGQPVDFFYQLLGYSAIAHALLYLVVTSRLGRAMRAIRMNEPLAQAQGIDPVRYRLLAVGLSALLAGGAGGLFVFYLTIVDPSVRLHRRGLGVDPAPLRRIQHSDRTGQDHHQERGAGRHQRHTHQSQLLKERTRAPLIDSIRRHSQRRTLGAPPRFGRPNGHHRDSGFGQDLRAGSHSRRQEGIPSRRARAKGGGMARRRGAERNGRARMDA